MTLLRALLLKPGTWACPDHPLRVVVDGWRATIPRDQLLIVSVGHPGSVMGTVVIDWQRTRRRTSKRPRSAILACRLLETRCAPNGCRVWVMTDEDDPPVSVMQV